MKTNTLISYLNELLKIFSIPDSSINGLQVEGVKEVQKIGLAVDACMDTYKIAKKKGCQMLIVHHGIIWHGIRSVTGAMKKQLEFLINSGINLYGAHLPLDMHPEYGNNIELARTIGLKDIKPFGAHKGLYLGFMGKLEKPMTNKKIVNKFQKTIGGKEIILPFGKKENKTLAIVSGGAAEALDEAIKKNVDCFITGEGPHHTYHQSKEAQINLIYLSHYHSEKLGVISLGRHIEEKFGVKTEFIDVPTVF